MGPDKYVPAPVPPEVNAEEPQSGLEKKQAVRAEVDEQLKQVFNGAVANNMFSDALAALVMRLKLNGIDLR